MAVVDFIVMGAAGAAADEFGSTLGENLRIQSTHALPTSRRLTRECGATIIASQIGVEEKFSRELVTSAVATLSTA